MAERGTCELCGMKVAKLTPCRIRLWEEKAIPMNLCDKCKNRQRDLGGLESEAPTYE